MARMPKINTPSSISTQTDPGQGKTLPVVVILSTLLLVALCVAGYFYFQAKQGGQEAKATAEEIKTLSEEIGAVFKLPEGEEPTLATVTDKERLADQPFFQNAENGDKVLIYSSSGRAILYRPSEKKIIDVTTVNVEQPTEEATAPAESAPAPEPAAEAVPVIIRLALYNGSTTPGVTSIVENQLKPVLPNAVAVTKEDAAKKDYTKSIVVDVTGKSAAAAAQIASTIGGEVGTLPDGEKTPADSDILIIVGNDRSS